jgi:hypothetical protein
MNLAPPKEGLRPRLAPRVGAPAHYVITRSTAYAGACFEWRGADIFFDQLTIRAPSAGLLGEFERHIIHSISE